MTAAAYYKSVKKDRDAWRDEMPDRCMLCRKRFGGLRWPEIHEIERRAQAPLSWAVRTNYLKLCNPCHWGMDDAEAWPHARQLALKMVSDREHFDLGAWLEIKPRPATYVTMAEINDWLQTLFLARRTA